jgi:carboxypeptidase T
MSNSLNDSKKGKQLFLVRIIARSIEQLEELEKMKLSLKRRAARHEDVNKFVITGIVTPKQFEELESKNFLVQILADLSKESTNRLKELSIENRFTDPNKMPDFKNIAALKYMNADEIDSVLANLHTLYPDLVSVIDLPYKTWNSRVCKAVYVHAGKNNDSDRVGVFVTGGIHAREWGGSDICINFLVNLIQSYKNKTDLTYGDMTFTHSQVQNMMENIDLYVFPDVNPDGKIFSQKNDDPDEPSEIESIWWRKNRNPHRFANGDSLFHITGVDVNRNFDFLWSSGIGTLNPDDTNHNETYRGEAAFSEPETKNVRHMFDTYGNIRYFVDVHSFGEKILYSWGDDDNQSQDLAQNFRNPEYDGKRGFVLQKKKNSAKDKALAKAYAEFIPKSDEDMLLNLANKMNGALSLVRGRSYTVQQGVELYPTSATSDDYAFSRHLRDETRNKIYGFTIEFGREEVGFIPPVSEMKNIIQEVGSALTEMCLSVYDNENLKMVSD